MEGGSCDMYRQEEPVTAEDSAPRSLQPLIILHRMSRDRIGSSVMVSLTI